MDREKLEKLKKLNEMIADYLDQIDLEEADREYARKNKKKEDK